MSENSSKTILVIGTFDTKNDELFYLSDCIQKQNGNVLTMDVSVLGDQKMNAIFPSMTLQKLQILLLIR